MSRAETAQKVLDEGLGPYFENRLTPSLGREIFGSIRSSSLRSEGLDDEYHAEEIFSRVILDALTYLRRHGGSEVANPRAWLHMIRRRATTRYIQQESHYAHKRGARVLEQLLEGRLALSEVQNQDQDQDQVMVLVCQAMKELRPRQREVIALDLVQGLTSDQIRERMKIRSSGYYRKLKCEAFASLRKALQASLQNWVGSVL